MLLGSRALAVQRARSGIARKKPLFICKRK
jgi:hypothetical protein